MALRPVRRPDLAIALTGLGLGGVQRTMSTLARGFAERGLAVDLVVPDAAGPFRSAVPDAVWLVELGGLAARTPWLRARKRRRTLASTPALARYLERERPQALLAASHYVNVSALAARRLAGVPVPVVISQRTHLSRAIANAGFPFRRRPLLGALVRASYPAAERIVAVSEGVADDLAEVAGIPRARIHALPNPLELDAVREGAAKPAPHPWLAEKELPVCVGLGRLAPQKDFQTLLEAFARLRERRPARLLLLGEGRLRPALEARARELGIEACAELPGYVDNPFAWLARADLFILSSRYEGLPGALIQALACGCPVVSTACPSGPREILREGRLGALVPVGDPRALADAMETALAGEGPGSREERLARAADFGLDRVVDAWLEQVEEAKRCAARR